MLKSDYSQAKSLAEAISICQQSLTGAGKEEYARLITEVGVRLAINTALESYKYILEKKNKPYGEDYPWVTDKEVERQIKHFEEVVKPVYLDIADNGSWPTDASFFYSFFKEDDNLVRYDGLALRLQIKTPGTMFHGFSVPILDLYYGRFTYEEDDI